MNQSVSRKFFQFAITAARRLESFNLVTAQNNQTLCNPPRFNFTGANPRINSLNRNALHFSSRSRCNCVFNFHTSMLYPPARAVNSKIFNARIFTVDNSRNAVYKHDCQRRCESPSGCAPTKPGGGTHWEPPGRSSADESESLQAHQLHAPARLGRGQGDPGDYHPGCVHRGILVGCVMTQGEYDKLHALVKQFQKMLAVETLDIEVETFIRSQIKTVEQLLDAYDQQEVAA